MAEIQDRVTTFIINSK